MITVEDQSAYDLSRRDFIRVAERLWLEHHHARAGFSLSRMAHLTGEPLSTLHRSMARAGLNTDPRNRRSDMGQSEREARVAVRAARNEAAEQAAAAELYESSLVERAGVSDPSQIVDLPAEGGADPDDVNELFADLEPEGVDQ
jgi:2-hydroxychromene-2-carboxylate isomerase